MIRTALPRRVLPGVRLYHDNVIDHFENPRNVGTLDKKSKRVGTGMSLSKSWLLCCGAPYGYVAGRGAERIRSDGSGWRGMRNGNVERERVAVCLLVDLGCVQLLGRVVWLLGRARLASMPVFAVIAVYFRSMACFCDNWCMAVARKTNILLLLMMCWFTRHVNIRACWGTGMRRCDATATGSQRRRHHH